MRELIERLEEQSGGKKTWKVADFMDFFEELKKKGLDDKVQWEKMLKRAVEIADKQGKGDDKNVVIGILQSFFKG